MSNTLQQKKEQAQKQTTENSSTILAVPELPSTSASVLPFIRSPCYKPEA